MNPKTLAAILGQGAAAAPAIVVPGSVTITYEQLREQVKVAAEQLAGFGLGRTDPIALVPPNSAESIVVFLAAATAGIAAPLNAVYKPEEFRFYLGDTGAKALVVPANGGEAARSALSDQAIL